MTPNPKAATSTFVGKLSRSSSKASTADASPSAQAPDADAGAAPAEADDARDDGDAPEELVPEDGNAGSDSSKLKQLLGILKRSLGVKDLAAVRLSLPANLLEPVGNLEHWHYQSRPDIFAAIGDSDDQLERMLAALRYAFTKDLKHAREGVCKPYNSALGEQFRSIWEVQPAHVDPETHELVCSEYLDPERKIFDPAANASSSSLSSVKSLSSKKSASRLGVKQSASKQSSPTLKPSSASGTDDDLASDARSKLALSDTSSVASSSGAAEAQSTAQTSVASRDGASRREQPAGKARVIFVNEQISHHPPISAFWNESVPADGRGQRVVGIGYDQISAKFTGTSVKVFAGGANKGIFVQLPDRNGEEYRITHPVANVSGFFRGSLYVTVSDSTYITCSKPERGRHLRAIVAYIDESWVGKPKYGLEGVVYDCAGPDADEYRRPKDVPEDKVVARFAGSWRGKITYSLTRGDDQSERTLIDLSELLVVPKIVRPPAKQGSRECRRFWAKVSDAIRRKEYSAATKHKQVIEQAQRDAAAARAKKSQPWVPAFFPAEISEDGKPHLTEGGERARREELEAENYADD